MAAGGDGTLNAVAGAVLGSGCPFGVVAQGTFNYFARRHGISSGAAEATGALLTARTGPVQVGVVNERVFPVSASLGLYPQLLEDREAEKQRHGRSRLVAAWSALLPILRTPRPIRMELDDGRSTRELSALSLSVCNNRLQLEQVGRDESSVVEDGSFAACATRPRRHKDGELSNRKIMRVAERLPRAAASQLHIVVVHISHPRRRLEFRRPHPIRWFCSTAPMRDRVLGFRGHEPAIRTSHNSKAGNR